MSSKHQHDHASHGHASHGHGQAGHGHDHPEHGEHENHEDDLILVPKGKSRGTYLFILGLMLFVLVIFTVGDQFQSVVGGGGGASDGSAIYATWQNPLTKSEQRLTEREFFEKKRALDLLSQGLGMWAPLDFEASSPRIEDEDVVLFAVLGELAAHEGLAVHESDIVALLVGAGFTDETRYLLAQRYRMDVPTFMQVLRDSLPAVRLRGQIQNAAFAYADPDAVVAAFQEQNPEYRLQYIELEREGFVEQAKANRPEDADLRAWFDELPEFRRKTFYTEAKVRPVVAYLPLDDEAFDGSALLEKYPPLEGTDPEARGDFFYKLARGVRFVKPAAETPDDQEGEDGAEDEESGQDTPAPAKEFYEYAEVQERAAKEAALWDAMAAFLDDVRSRSLDPEVQVDWQAEAEALGLSLDRPEAPLTRSELEQQPLWGTAGTAAQISFNQADAFVPRVQITEDSIVLAFVAEKVDPEPRPFEDITEEVLTLWAEENAQEIAVDQLNGLKQLLAERPVGDDGEPLPFAEWLPEVADDKAFIEQASGLGFSVLTRDFLGRNENQGGPESTPLPVENFLRMHPEVYDLEPGQVGVPAADFSGQRVFLVRMVEQRDPPVDKMKPTQLLSLRQQQQGERYREFLQQGLDPRSDFFKSTFAVTLKSWETTDEDGDETPTGDAPSENG